MLSRGWGSMQAAAVLSWGDAAHLEAVAMPGACRQENFSPRSDRALIPQAEMGACRACPPPLLTELSAVFSHSDVERRPCTPSPSHTLRTWLLPQAPTPVAQPIGHGAGGEAGPPKCPQFHIYPWRTRPCQGWFPTLQPDPLLGRIEGKSRAQPGNSACTKHGQVSFLRRVTSDPNSLPW